MPSEIVNIPLKAKYMAMRPFSASVADVDALPAPHFPWALEGGPGGRLPADRRLREPGVLGDLGRRHAAFQACLDADAVADPDPPPLLFVNHTGFLSASGGHPHFTKRGLLAKP